MRVDPRAKIHEAGELERRLASERKRGRRIVFANGCFDLLHAGHIRYLEGARELGDLLVVGINSDASVLKLKGAGRPLQPERERAEIIASLECVNHVVVFDDLTVDRMLSALKPHIHAKGTDYTAETVPERETVSSYGGSVAIVGDPKSHSSRDLIGTILAKMKR
jgi:rfaE bifunctional protein nucleotidyltransferase chain/domain